MMRKWRFSLFAPTAVLLGALLGGLYGPRIGVASAASDDDFKESFREFTKALAIIEQNYADPVDSEKAIYNGAIPVMLRALDPHSQFLDPDAFRRMRDDQKGEYAGVGMQIGPDPTTERTVVIFPFPKTPAYRAGLRPRDIIAEVDGESTDGLNTEEVASKLRGPAGTQVNIGIERRGVEQLLHFRVTRASIPRKSVPIAFEIKPNIGFIKVEGFTEATGKELDEALEQLNAGKLQGLILDLRDNRGGLLSEGVHVSDRFLEKGQAIVSHHGRNAPERVYKAQDGNDGVVYPMIVMANCHSASASEIVAGALQDHDRALVVGNNTFGKGLVQTVYQLDQVTGLLLTTARYYTPSGRLIQRRYDNVSLSDYYSNPCTEQYKPAHDEVKLTDQGRQVFGGGGITPDVKLTEEQLNPFQVLLRRMAVFSTFAQDFTRKNPNLPEGWEPTDLVLEEFRQFLHDEKVEFQEVDFIENLGFIKRYLKREVYVAAYDLDEGMKVFFALDPEVQQALGPLPQAEALLKNGKQMVAREQGQ
jgi:carboxyl-terminal processing protease